MSETSTRYKLQEYLTSVMSITINISYMSYFSDKHDSRIMYDIEAVGQKIFKLVINIE